MIDKNTNSVLFELQKNLEDLSSAKEQVDFFRGKSLEITDGISEVKRKYVEHLQSIKSDYESRVKDLKTELTSFLTKNQDENSKTIQKIISKSEETIEKGVDKFDLVSKKVETSNNEKIEGINNLLEHYKGVVQASNSLIETLSAIDFPTKLDALSSKSHLIIESITSAKQALEIKLNETQNSIIDKTTSSKEQVIQNNDSKITSLAEKLSEANSSLKSTFTYALEEQSKQTKSELGGLSTAFEKRFIQTNEHLAKQDEEIKILKISLFVAIGIIIIGIALNIFLK
ncbi:hypothetical protein [Aquiflexum lacus]|uniref:hypothetical protein n=1 Tax=Aquiflexum lacus TaxID=2483805 RepID=UPI0018955413|nr:hypothetical protein [Aquiflexum lacus]